MATKKVGGRPRKPLPGGHRNRRPGPTEQARLKQLLRDAKAHAAQPHPRHPDPAGPEHRTVVLLKTGRTRGGVLKKGHHMGGIRGQKKNPLTAVRASVRSILEKVVKEKGATIETAVIDGLQSGPRHADRFIKLTAEYVDGKPAETMNLNARWNQDELSEARERLGKKMDSILSTLLKNSSGEK